MNKTFPTLLFSSALIVLSSCTQQNTKTEVTIQTEQTIDEVHSMPDYSYIDSLMQGSHKVVYSIANKPGKKVAFYQNVCADFARMQAYDDLGGWGVVTIWEVTEVK